VNELEYVTF